jgi:hypothetical protein
MLVASRLCAFAAGSYTFTLTAGNGVSPDATLSVPIVMTPAAE